MTETLAEALAREAELQRRKFVHVTRSREPLTLKQAQEVCRRIDEANTDLMFGDK